MATRHPEAYRRMLMLLRQARKDAGLTQVDVALRLGVIQKFVSKVELGERRIDPFELRELATLYGKPMSFFMEGDEEDGIS